MRIWTNADRAPNLCERAHLVDNKHAKTAQRGGRGVWNGGDAFERDELYALPVARCDDIYTVARS